MKTTNKYVASVSKAGSEFKDQKIPSNKLKDSMQQGHT